MQEPRPAEMQEDQASQIVLELGILCQASQDKTQQMASKLEFKPPIAHLQVMVDVPAVLAPPDKGQPATGELR